MCVASVHETAYLRLNPNPRPSALEATFTPMLEEIELTRRVARIYRPSHAKA